MTAIQTAASDFLTKRRIAVTGVSRTPASHGSNVVYRYLRDHGYQVFAVNPNTDRVEGDTAYPNLAAIPGGVDAVVIGTRPERADGTMRECIDLGIKNVWMHRGPGAGSVSPSATALGRANGIAVIDGGCPLMFGESPDFGHRAIRLVFSMTGSIPHEV